MMVFRRRVFRIIQESCRSSGERLVPIPPSTVYDDWVSGPMSSSPAFPQTRWTLILAAGQSENQAADEALDQLCRAYWYPIYAFIRRLGNPPDEAQDLT